MVPTGPLAALMVGLWWSFWQHLVLKVDLWCPFGQTAVLKVALWDQF